MAANPKRKGTSTIPVYLPDVPVRRQTTQKEIDASDMPRVYVDGGFDFAAAEALAQSLEAASGVEVQILGDMLPALPRGAQLVFRHKVATAGRALAASRVLDPEREQQASMPLRGAVDQEEASLHAKSYPQFSDRGVEPTPADMQYEAVGVQAAYRDLLPKAGQRSANVVITSRALASWDGKAKRWVPQTLVPGNPIVIGAGAQPDTLADELSAALKE